MDILEIELLTDDLEKTRKFYSEILGFDTVFSSANTVSFRTGESILTFNQSTDVDPKYHFAFNIPCNKITEALRWISEKTEIIKTSDDKAIADFDTWNAKACFFYDNNENIVEFISRADLNTLSDMPFDILSVIAISEIGIVTDEPLVFADKLSAENKLSYFSKGKKSEDFVALGNDNGLFIVVRTSRNWYPTNIKAQKYFTKIKFWANYTLTEITFNEINAKK
jgi:catechol 2,3-dioxygenase-like lactoylglutathione lyase family enzyme